jgi:hypothetical protein
MNRSQGKRKVKVRELDKLDQIILQLKIISRELIFQNAKAKEELFRDKNVNKIFDSCIDGATIEELVSKSGLSKREVENTLEILNQQGFVQRLVPLGGSAEAPIHIPTDPHPRGWYVACINGIAYVYSAYPCPNTHYTQIWGPFSSQSDAWSYCAIAQCKSR